MPDSDNRPQGLRRGVFSLLVGQWGKYLLQVLSFIVLARLLSPSDFGLVTMMTAVLGIATVLGDMGLSMAALQRESLSQGEKSNLFWLNLLTGAVATALAAGASPFLALFYGQPQLTVVGLVISLTFLLNGASVQAKVELNRKGRFTTLAGIDLAGQAIAFGVAVLFAVLGAGVWALVAQSLVAPLVGGSWAIVAAAWRPSGWSRDVAVKSFLTFGLSTLALQTLNYVSVNVANVVVGRTMTPAAVGIYGRATQLISLPVQQLASPLTRIALPYLAERSRQSASAFESAAVSIQRMLVVVLLGALSLLAATADPLVPLLLGPDWSAAVPLVQILTIGGAFQTLGYLYYWLFLSTARAGHLLAAELPGRILLIVLVLLTWPLGLPAIAWSFTVSQIVIWAVGSLFFVHRAGVRPLVLVGAAAPVTLLYSTSAVLAIFVGEFFPDVPSILRVVVCAVVWLCTVLLGFWVIPSCRRALSVTIRTLRSKER